MRCPMCGLEEKFQENDEDTLGKSKCKGCGVKFFNRDLR